MTQPNGERVMEGTGLMIRVEQNVTEDAQGVPHNKAKLVISGVANKEVDLGDIQGELQYVDPASYPVYAEQENLPETVGLFTSWFAGQGEEVSVTIFNQYLYVGHRMGDESGTCTKSEELAQIKLGRDVVVEWENLPTQIPNSSLAFCDKK
jgi:hypothetical protein